MARTWRFLAVLAAGATALLATACAGSLGYNTPCSVWVSMNASDQESTLDTVYQQEGATNPPNSTDYAEFRRRASAYCANPIVNQPTIIGMLDSRAQ